MSVFTRLPKFIQCANLRPHKIVPIWNFGKRPHLQSNFSTLCTCNHFRSNRSLDSWHARTLDTPTLGNTFKHCYATVVAGDMKTSKKDPLKKTGGPTPQKKFVRFDYSGDLEKLPEPVKAETLFGYNEIDALNDEKEEIKRIHTLEFADGRQRIAHEKWMLRDEMIEVCGPFNDYEKQIARDTIHIRHLIKHCMDQKKDKRSKVILIEKIAKRKKKLKYLRKMDFERFMWLLKKLRIQYIPEPQYKGKLSHAAQAKKAARDKVIAFRVAKLKELKGRLEKEYENFKIHKEKELADIEKIIQEYGFDKTQILKNVEKQLTENLASEENIVEKK